MNASNNKIVVINTVSNYALIAVRIVYVILITRFLFKALGEDYYGFWSILWALFTYVVIFNFGFGTTIQKYTAEHLFENDPLKYNKIISLIIEAYALASAVILCIVAAGIVYIRSWTNIAGAPEVFECRTALAIFGAGIAVLFPLSTFVDILTGLRLIYMKNAVMIMLRVAEMIGVYALIHCRAGFIPIVCYSIFVNIFFMSLLIVIAKRKIPSFRIVPHTDSAIFREIWHFSFFVYLNSLAMLITAKTDRFILSSILGLPAVSSYQIGTRLPEMSQSLSSQFQDNVIPVAANLAKANDTRSLRAILTNGMRFSAFVSVGASVAFFLLSGATTQALFGVNSPEIDLICKIFLISQFVYCAVRNVPYRYLQVSQKHKQIAVISTLQAVATIALGIIFCKRIGVVGIAWAALIPNAFFSVAVIFPMAFKKLNYSAVDIFKIYRNKKN